jgi:hypothetical protein
MNIGMLWFDNDTKVDLNSKIHRAAGYYKDKYGRKPNLCYIHPTMAGKPENKSNDSSSMRAGDIEVRTTRSVLPNHIWIGVNHANGTAPTAGG